MKKRNLTPKIKLRHKKKVERTIIICSIFAILIALYCLACFQLDNKVIWKNVSANGISLIGMTKKEAGDALAKNLEKKYKDTTLTVQYNNETYKVNITPVLDYNVSKDVDKVYKLGHRGFLLRGVDWMLSKTLYGKEKEITIYPVAKSAKTLNDSIAESGLPQREPASETTWEVTDTALVIHKGINKEGADWESLEKQIIKAVDKHDYSSTITCPMTEKGPQDVDFQKVYDEIHKEKKNATLDKANNYAVVPSQNTISFDVKEAQSQYDACDLGGEIEIPLSIEEPEVTTAKLESNLFTTELASYSTTGGGSEGRRTNISLAVQSCNGVILLPGETFSYNDVLGERTADKGYQPAGAYSDGEVVEQLGGGICQVSSTLFAAVLHTDLEIITRANHSMPVSYLPMGMDATVSWGGPEFKFKNNFAYPIKISASYSGGTITFKILGAASDKKKIEVEIKKTGEMSAETYRKYYDENGNVTSTKRVARSNYKPHS